MMYTVVLGSMVLAALVCLSDGQGVQGLRPGQRRALRPLRGPDRRRGIPSNGRLNPIDPANLRELRRLGMLGRREERLLGRRFDPLERRLGRIGRLPLVTPLSPINRLGSLWTDFHLYCKCTYLVSRRQLRLLRRGRLLGIGRIGSPINLPGCTCRTTSRCFFRRTGVPCFNRFTGTLGTNCCPFPLIFPG